MPTPAPVYRMEENPWSDYNSWVTELYIKALIGEKDAWKRIAKFYRGQEKQ